MDPSRCNIWVLVIAGEGRQPRLLITACGTGYGCLLGVAFLVWAYITAVGDRPRRCGRCQRFISHRDEKLGVHVAALPAAVGGTGWAEL